MQKLTLWLFTLLWAGLIWRLTTSTQIQVTQEYWLQNLLMMGAHFSFFGVQAVLLRLSLTLKHEAQPSFLAVAMTSIYGLLIEFRQLTVPGRSSDPIDWLLDTLGAITFLLILKKLQSRS